MNVKIREVFLKINKFRKENPTLIRDIKRIVYMLLFSFVFLFLFANRAKLYPENIILYFEGKMKSVSFSKKFPTEIEGKIEQLSFIGEDIITLSNTHFNVLNDKGNIIRSEKHSFGNPRCKASGVKAIAYDVGGKDYRIESIPKTLGKMQSEEKIIACDIAENGSYGVLTGSRGYLSEVSIFNSQNTEKYKYYFSQCQATDICMEPLGDKCIVSGISFENGKINSMIYILNFKSEKPDNTFGLDDNMVFCVNQFQNGNILAIGDKYLTVINTKLGITKKFDYEGKSLKFFDFDKQYGFVCCLSPSMDIKKDDEIAFIDNLGKENEIIKTGENLNDIAHSKNRIFALSDGKITIYNITGRLEGHLKNEKIYEKIILKSDSSLYASQSSTLEEIKIKNLDK